ncbi:unnamed protein product [Cyprideis torosa]|uniref:Uncharacterized protein n=1 Tax=Cyprideis torosa TaxID=163714 RepID=A0A7R8ZXC8_9CRUS|nr:unnamed protein product [Cyprideis torosa]CAG0906591.1 unnamed protein product [Cyprideis torosa]
MVPLVLLLALCVWVVVSPPSFLVDLLELKLPPMPEGTTFIVTILAAAAINFILAFLVEYVFINRLLARQCLPRFHRIETCKRRYLHLDQLMSRSSQRPYLPSDPSWAVPENQTSSAEPGR